MPTPASNIGRDAQVIVQGPTGQLQLNVTDFDYEDEPHEVTSRPLNSETTTTFVPDRGKGRFAIDRNSNVLDVLISSGNALYDGGGVIPFGSVYAYITELNGSVTTVMFTNVAFKVSKAGSYKQNEVVKQMLEFVYSRSKVV